MRSPAMVVCERIDIVRKIGIDSRQLQIAHRMVKA